jgi:hypothetical protein
MKIVSAILGFAITAMLIIGGASALVAFGTDPDVYIWNEPYILGSAPK